MGTNDSALAQRVEHSPSTSDNPRVYAPEHLTRPLESIATAQGLAVFLDVDALGRGSPRTHDRFLTLALDALAHLGVQVVVVARVATDRAVALQRALPPRRPHDPSFRKIVISNDPELLATLGPEDRGFTVMPSPVPSHGVMSGESSLRLVLWWLVASRAAAGMARRERENHEDARDPAERDLFDSPSDSWRDLEHRQMLDEIERSPAERL
jgi:hypothetical protein